MLTCTVYSLTPRVVWPLQDVTWKNFIVQTHTVQNTPEISENRARPQAGREGAVWKDGFFESVCVVLISAGMSRCYCWARIANGAYLSHSSTCWVAGELSFVVNHWPDVWQLCSNCSEIHKYIFVQLTWTLIVWVIQHSACLTPWIRKEVKELFI